MSYFQPQKFTLLPPVVKNLLILNGLFFLAAIALSSNYYFPSLAMHHWNTSNFKIWQPITYMFMHGDFFHIFFNMWGVWMFGTQLENLWGSKRFLQFYILTGLGAGILHFILFPGPIPLVGASGALFGLLLGFGMMFPNAQLMLIFLPVPIKAKYFVIIYGLMELYYGFTSTGNIAHFAHLGGMLFGFLIIKYWKSKQNSS